MLHAKSVLNRGLLSRRTLGAAGGGGLGLGLGDGTVGPMSFESAGGSAVFARWKMKKASGKCKQGGNRMGKRLGRKYEHGEFVKSGYTLVTQRGAKVLPGPGTGQGRNDTIYALQHGRVQFLKLQEGRKVGRVQASVIDVHSNHPELMKTLEAEKVHKETVAKRELRSKMLKERKSIIPEYAKQMTIHLHKMKTLFTQKSRSEMGGKVWF
mmetsp:Transcript_10570/g.32356  ORF Transcript_10570/g.32356 Transcript_10570/m.32356 type:complete len:210 (+) Transcript_10570:151-780(+)